MALHNFFELFSLPQSYQVDEELLRERYRAMQRVVHPDRHAQGSAQERRLAIQRSGLINEAYQTLCEPLARARHLMECAGVEVDKEFTTDDQTMLTQQLSLQERLAELSAENNKAGMTEMQTEIEQQWQKLQGDFAGSMADTNTESALAHYHQLQFLRRLRQQLQERIADL